MKQSEPNGLRRILGDLSTEQLQQILEEELQKDHSDPAVVRLLLTELEERHASNPESTSSVGEEARQKYRQQMESLFPPKPECHWKPLLKVASVLLICGVLFWQLLPQKAEAKSLWEMLQRLSAGVVEFFGREDLLIEKAYAFETDNEGLQQVFDMAVEMGVEYPMVPMWLPGESVLQDLWQSNSPTMTGLQAFFLDGDAEIVYTLNVYEREIKHRYYRDDSFYDSYEHNGVTYTISSNNDRIGAIWKKDNIECSIILDCQEETLRRILKSVYVMGE